MNSASKHFPVFGEDVEVIVSSASTNNAFNIVVQTCPPGGGPPPHVHSNEDEIFTSLSGNFELFDGEKWTRLAVGETGVVLRNTEHTFPNVGPEPGRLRVLCTNGGLDEYLEAISPLTPADTEELFRISDEYGIHFTTLGHQRLAGAPAITRGTPVAIKVPNKRFPVFGDEVEILVGTDATGGRFTFFTQDVRPGGGPPPHTHNSECQILWSPSGSFSVFNGKSFVPVAGDTALHALPGEPHTFHNTGTTYEKVYIVVLPGAFQQYLKKMGGLSIPEDMEQLMALSQQYGVSSSRHPPRIAPQ